MLSATSNASATGLIFSPVSGVINNGGPGFGSLADTYNQNGLATNFVSGVTDFDSYLALNPTHTFAYSGNEWFSNFGTQSTTVTYDLGSVRSIDRLALWNEDASGIGRLNLAYSTDNITFSSLAAGLTPFNNALNSAYPADVFAFATTNARYVRFEASECRQSVFAACAIGEVAFSISNPTVSVPNRFLANSATAAVPEPLTIAGTLFGGTAVLRIRKRLKATNKL
ncbi:discoidin domain-containing protein [Chamaesiphon sp. OTE_75_metabat_556]|uniref:discoidin domain-containing protein n=1 Tax=Chamaesiphon sp. OTE_75_metabat_556 TaxID=2964692 RepID=UPI00286A0A24|nr:discoidin domain-containing protein [Chamaesiphon sp. OTE_75_metabat_556]